MDDLRVPPFKETPIYIYNWNMDNEIDSDIKFDLVYPKKTSYSDVCI